MFANRYLIDLLMLSLQLRHDQRPCSHVLVQDYKADCEELAHPTIKDMTKLRMSTLQRHHPELVEAHSRMCAQPA